jgi:CTP:molybdopterin cytidylyltransferase MocA
MTETTCAILAAGASSRMGRDKAALVVDGATLLARALDACRAHAVVVVLPSRLLHLVPAHVRAVANDRPERGMAHSARLASEHVAPEHGLLVVLADMPRVTAALIDRVVAAPAADVAYPTVDGRPGHPVRFGPRARAKLGALPDGDTLRSLRDDPELSRTTFAVDDSGTQADIDTPADLRRIRG